MSHENVEAVRQAVSVATATRRRPEDHLTVLLPGLAGAINRAVLRLPPRSRLRQAVIRRAVQLGIEAVNRQDYQAAFGRFHPAVELIVPPGLASMGLEPYVQGRGARVRFEVKWRAEWGDFAYVPEELTDLGSRVLVTGRMRGSGQSSGAAFDIEWADLFTVSAGQVVREQVFLAHAEALDAAGLSATPEPATR